MPAHADIQLLTVRSNRCVSFIGRALVLVLLAAACEAPGEGAPGPREPPLVGLWTEDGREDRFIGLHADGTLDLLSWPASGEPLLVSGTYAALDDGVVEIAWAGRVDSAAVSAEADVLVLAEPDVLVLTFFGDEPLRFRRVGPEVGLSTRQRRHMVSAVQHEMRQLMSALERCHRERGSTYVGCDERLLEGRASIRLEVSGQTATDYEIRATDPGLGDLAESHPCRYRRAGGELPGAIVCALTGLDGELRYRMETGRLRARMNALGQALEECRERMGATYEGCDERLVTVPAGVSLEVSDQTATGYRIRGTAGERPRVVCGYRHDGSGVSQGASCMRLARD